MLAFPNNVYRLERFSISRFSVVVVLPVLTCSLWEVIPTDHFCTLAANKLQVLGELDVKGES